MTADGSELVKLNQLLELKNNLNAEVPSHKHAAGDITSGTLPLARGGTGTTTLVGTSGLIHNMFDTSGVTNYIATFTTNWADGGYATPQQLRNAMGLGNTTGVLPLANGGTGANSAASARTKLELQMTQLYKHTSGWYVYTNGRYVWVYAQGVNTGSGSWDTTTCGYTIPSNLRPAFNVSAPMVTQNGASWTACLCVLNTGKIQVQNLGDSGSSDNRFGIVMYPMEV